MNDVRGYLEILTSRSTTVTKRGQTIKLLRTLLSNNAEVCATLDQNTSDPECQDVTWASVVNAVLTYATLEAEKNINAKRPKSEFLGHLSKAISLADARHGSNTLFMLLSLFPSSSSRGNRTSFYDEFYESFLARDDIRNVYGSEALALLLKRVLSVSAYARRLTTLTADKLLRLSLNTLTTGPHSSSIEENAAKLLRWLIASAPDRVSERLFVSDSIILVEDTLTDLLEFSAGLSELSAASDDAPPMRTQPLRPGALAEVIAATEALLVKTAINARQLGYKLAKKATRALTRLAKAENVVSMVRAASVSALLVCLDTTSCLYHHERPSSSLGSLQRNVLKFHAEFRSGTAGFELDAQEHKLVLLCARLLALPPLSSAKAEPSQADDEEGNPRKRAKVGTQLEQLVQSLRQQTTTAGTSLQLLNCLLEVSQRRDDEAYRSSSSWSPVQDLVNDAEMLEAVRDAMEMNKDSIVTFWALKCLNQLTRRLKSSESALTPVVERHLAVCASLGLTRAKDASSVNVKRVLPEALAFVSQLLVDGIIACPGDLWNLLSMSGSTDTVAEFLPSCLLNMQCKGSPQPDVLQRVRDFVFGIVLEAKHSKQFWTIALSLVLTCMQNPELNTAQVVMQCAEHDEHDTPASTQNAQDLVDALFIRHENSSESSADDTWPTNCKSNAPSPFAIKGGLSTAQFSDLCAFWRSRCDELMRNSTSQNEPDGSIKHANLIKLLSAAAVTLRLLAFFSSPDLASEESEQPLREVHNDLLDIIESSVKHASPARCCEGGETSVLGLLCALIGPPQPGAWRAHGNLHLPSQNVSAETKTLLRLIATRHMKAYQPLAQRVDQMCRSMLVRIGEGVSSFSTAAADNGMLDMELDFSTSSCRDGSLGRKVTDPFVLEPKNDMERHVACCLDFIRCWRLVERLVSCPKDPMGLTLNTKIIRDDMCPIYLAVCAARLLADVLSPDQAEAAQQVSNIVAVCVDTEANALAAEESFNEPCFFAIVLSILSSLAPNIAASISLDHDPSAMETPELDALRVYRKVFCPRLAKQYFGKNSKSEPLSVVATTKFGPAQRQSFAAFACAHHSADPSFDWFNLQNLSTATVNSTAGLLALMARDRNHLCRLDFAQRIATAFHKTPETHRQALFLEVEQRLQVVFHVYSEPPQDDETLQGMDMEDDDHRFGFEFENHLVSALVTLANAAAGFPPAVRPATFHLMYQVSQHTLLKGLAAHLLAIMSRRLTFGSALRMFESSSRYVLSKWVANAPNAEDEFCFAGFPAALLGMDRQQICRKYEGTLVVLFITALSSDDSRTRQLQELANELQETDITVLVKRHLAPIMANTQRLRFEADTRDRYTHIFNQYLPGILAQDHLSRFFNEYCGTIACEMLDLVFADDDASLESVARDPMSISHARALEMLHHLKGKLGKSKAMSLSGLVFQQPHAAQQLLVRLLKRLHGEACLVDQRRQLAVLKALVLEVFMAQEAAGFLRSQSPFFFKAVMGSLVRLLQEASSLVGFCCRFAKQLLEAAAEANKAVAIVPYQECISALLPYVPGTPLTDPSMAVHWSKSDCLCLIELAFENLAEGGDPCLAVALPPLPHCAELAELCVKQREFVGSGTLRSEVEQFVSMDDRLVSSPTAIAYLLSIRTRLEKESADQSLCAELRLDLSRQCMRACQSVQGSSRHVLRRLVVECFGYLGCQPFDSLALCTSATNAADYGDPIREGKACIVAKLVHLLEHSSVEVVSAAARSMSLVASDQDDFHTIVSALSPRRRSSRGDAVSASAAPKIPRLFLTCFVPAEEVVDALQQENRALATALVVPSQTDDVFADELWLPKPAMKLEEWIMPLCARIIQYGMRSQRIQDFYCHLFQAVSASEDFCSFLLPYLVHELLHVDPTGEARTAISQHFNSILESFHGGKITDKRICATLLDTIHALRRFQWEPSISRGQDSRSSSRTNPTHWDNFNWLDLDFLSVAKAAAACDLHFSAVFFAEIAQELRRANAEILATAERAANRRKKSGTSSVSTDWNLQRLDSDVSKVLLNAFSSMGDTDGVFGPADVSDPMQLALLLEQEGRHHQALGVYDVLYGDGAPAGLASRHLLALNDMGLHTLAHFAGSGIGNGLQARSSTRGQYDQHIEEAAWRYTAWNTSPPSGSAASSAAATSQALLTAGCQRDSSAASHAVMATSSPDFHGHVRQLLDSMFVADGSVFEDAATRSLASLGDLIATRNFESTSAVIDVMQQSQMLIELQEMVTSLRGFKARKPVALSGLSQLDLREADRVVSTWAARDSIRQRPRFEASEAIMVLRCAILRRLHIHDKKAPSTSLLRRALDELVVQSREAGAFQTSLRAGRSLTLLADEHADVVQRTSASFQMCCTLWEMGEGDHARRWLNSMFDSVGAELRTTDQGRLLSARMQWKSGVWNGEVRAQQPVEVLESLQSAVEELKSSSAGDEAKARRTLAEYAENQFKSISNRLKSSEYQQHRRLAEERRAELKEIQALVKDEKSLRWLERRRRLLVSMCNLDQVSEKQVLDMQSKCLCTALEEYSHCLSISAEQQDAIFPLCSLWFQNSDDARVNEIISNSIPDIPNHVWLALIYQLSARLNTESTCFQLCLKQVIVACGTKHPFHVLPVLLALSNAAQSPKVDVTKKRRSKSSLPAAHTVSNNKASAAAALVDAIQSNESGTLQLGTITSQMRQLFAAYMQLANLNIKREVRDGDLASLNGKFELAKLRSVGQLPVITKPLPIDQTGKYDAVDIAYISQFEQEFTTAGGVNLPKIIKCIGTDGQRYRQVVKGKDDLRQDAVMQQVFGLVNDWLRDNEETRRRRLRIRTYKVVPLSQDSGVLQWCEGTTPLGGWLVKDRPSAHERYRPQDWPATQCRAVMEKASASEKRKKFDEVCRHFRPVFRRFFTERFHDPAEWFEKRLNYTRSVATSSIVGYFLGLGDRHPNNILLELSSAEVIHIDLGVAFEQGRLLPTPETIPFRLTRDVVDGMGVTGVEGVFRRSCEQAMKVMRASQAAMLTVLEVLLYDPLATWQLSVEKAQKVQRGSETDFGQDGDEGPSLPRADSRQSPAPESGEEINKYASLALMRVKQKLIGHHEGAQLGVQGHVNCLIQEARDLDRLSHLFPGWQPWV